MYTCCGKPKGLFFHMLLDIERELFLLQLSGENSVLASLRHRPGYRQITRMPRFGLLEAGTHVADVLRSFECNERIIYRMLTRFRQSGSKMTNLRQGDHR